MNNPVCISTTCPVTDDVASYLGSYNIQASVPYSNSLVSNVPVGDGFYISVPPGTFNVTVTPNTSSFTLQTISIPCPDGEVAETGCNLSYSYPIPAGATSAQIQQILDNATQQVAVIKGRCCIGFPPQPVQTWTNTPQSASCDGYGGLKVVGTLPGYATVSFTQVTINAGVFVSTISQADADNQASDAAVQLIDSSIIECGWWNMQQICTGGGTVAANLYFSTVSQADANSLAIAGGCVDCASPLIGLVWTPSIRTQDGATATISAAGASGAFNLAGGTLNNLGYAQTYISTTITNPNSSDCIYTVTTTLGGYVPPATGAGTFFAYLYPNGFPPYAFVSYAGGVTGPNPISFTVPANSSLYIEYHAECGNGGSDIGVAVSGSFVITPN